MTGYAKTMWSSLGLSALAHVAGVAICAVVFAGWASDSTPAQIDVTQLVLIETAPAAETSAEPEEFVPPIPQLESLLAPAPAEDTPHFVTTENIVTAITTTNALPPLEMPIVTSSVTAITAPISFPLPEEKTVVLPSAPDYLQNPKPAYPAAAKRHGWEGTTLLRVEVLKTGQVNRVEILKGSGHPDLDEAAVAAIRVWKFIPARLGDDPITCHVEVPISFKLLTD